MLEYKKNIVILMILIPFFVGCSDEWYCSETLSYNNEELPVDFDFVLPESQDTRGFDDGTEVRTKFNTGDMIHILGTFNTKSLMEDGTYKDGVVNRYGALSYNGKIWVEVPGNKLTWPSTAINGKFHAYYISGSDGVLTNEDPTQTTLLSTVTPTTDPLEAFSGGEDVNDEDRYVEYGHGVRLRFSHMCAHLTLVELEPMVASSYFFECEGNEKFNNAFKISLGKSTEEQTLGQPTLEFEFFRAPDTKYSPDSKYNDKEQTYSGVYIASDVVESKVYDENNNEKIITKANYFLEPGKYYQFSLSYPATASSTYPYLKYDYNSIPDNVGGEGKENIPPILEKNTTYTLTITKSPGITITNPPSGDGWDDSGKYSDVDVYEFLKAVYNNKSYTNEAGEDILEEIVGGTRLLCNVDFKNEKYNYEKFAEKGFLPNVMGGSVFDGGCHYIKNLASPLFRYNYGSVKNIGINDVKIEEEAFEYDSTDDGSGNEEAGKQQYDMSRYGALCMWNRGNATIDNVRITNVTMNIGIQSYINTNDDGSETFNIGGVLGSNTGKVSEVSLAGKFELIVGNKSTDVNASVLIGGIVGQNAAEGEIYDVSPLDETLSIDIKNNCRGPIGSYSVGGVVGESTGKIIGVILSDVSVDGTGSSGVASYMGGIAGKMEVSTGFTETASINSCIVNGSIKAGNTQKFGDVTSDSYTGGIVGADLGVPVVDCRTAISVYGPQIVNPNVIYATGGAFGRIRAASNYKIENLIAYGTALRKPNDNGSQNTTNYVGNFAGIVPQGQTWQDNYANKNIIVRQFAGFEPIGGDF